MSLTTEAKATVDDYRETDQLLRGRLDTYCETLVKIQDEDGNTVPFVWNEAQRRLDEIIGRQYADIGMVRLIVLKARKLGISTYVAARFYRKTSLWEGQNTYILTHEDPATQTLFGMAKRVHDYMPNDYRPHVSFNNANELAFSKLDSGYRVGTAKNVGGTGRSQTRQNLHGSEVAFWAQAEKHFKGVVQAVPGVPNSEIILESTANGIGGAFYDQWCMAEKGKSLYRPVFLPWFLKESYRRIPPKGFVASHDELEYADLYGLDEHQVAWLRFKNVELLGEPGEICSHFNEEYPATSQEAFQATGEEGYIHTKYVVRARKLELQEDDSQPRVLGIDCARGGKDDTRIIDRKGRKAGGSFNISLDTDDTMVIVDRVCLILKNNPDIQMAFIDLGSFGAAIYDRICQLGFSRRITGVWFNAPATEADKYRNKRSEIWGRMKGWLLLPGGVDLPDDDDLHRHICGPSYRYTDEVRLQMEPKRKIKKRLGFSPDGGDALALTFAETVILGMSREPSWHDDDPPGGGLDPMTL